MKKTIILLGILMVLVLLYGCSGITGNVVAVDTKVDCQKGDINRDGLIGEDDLLLLNAFLERDVKFNDAQLFCADVNSDRVVDVDDKALIIGIFK